MVWSQVRRRDVGLLWGVKYIWHVPILIFVVRRNETILRRVCVPARILVSMSV